MVGRLIAVAAPLVLAASLVASASGGGPLRTAVVEPPEFDLAGENVVFERMHGAGATAVRMDLSWFTIAPKTLPASFDPENPADPAYDWSALDARIQAAFAHGLEPYLVVNDAPVWARLDNKEAGSPPNAADLGKFMHAAAERYSGSDRAPANPLLADLDRAEREQVLPPPVRGREADRADPLRRDGRRRR